MHVYLYVCLPFIYDVCNDRQSQRCLPWNMLTIICSRHANLFYCLIIDTISWPWLSWRLHSYMLVKFLGCVTLSLSNLSFGMSICALKLLPNLIVLWCVMSYVYVMEVTFNIVKYMQECVMVGVYRKWLVCYVLLDDLQW